MVFAIKSLTSSLTVMVLLLTSKLVVASSAVLATFQQIGSDIDGEALVNQFGRSVSMSADGTTFVGGAPNNNGVNGTNSGHVRVYKFNSTINTYVQLGLDIDGEAAGDLFGWSVSMSADGTTFVVGAPLNHGIGGFLSGHVRVYKFNSTIHTYVQVGSDIDGEAAGDRFGWTVSMSADGTTFVVGAPYTTLRDFGHVRVYKFDSTTNMYAQVGLDIDGEAAGDEFGTSVSMSADGTTFVVGAPYNNGVNGAESGHVRVYKLNSSINRFAKIGLDIDGEAAGDQFGSSVSMSADGTTFVASAIYNDGIGGFLSGHVRVYKFNSTIHTYVQVGSDIDSEEFSDQFGTSVSMSADGTTFVVGAPLNNGVNGTDSGHVRVYKFDSIIDSYTQVGLDIEGEAFFDYFGTSVSMSADGTTFVVGAIFNNGMNGVNSGHVRVYSSKRPNMVPTKSPTKQPATVNCQVSWKLFNSQTDSFVANLSNGTTVSKAPPCTRTNIEALVPCGDSNNQVMLELYNATSLVQRRVERVLPYFLFGDRGENIYNGRIAPGTFRIRAKVNGVFSPFTTFTLKGPACN